MRLISRCVFFIRIPAKIVSIDKTAYELKNGVNKCNSPSSDKENSSDEKAPKKWMPPKVSPV